MIEKDDPTPSPERSGHVPVKSAWLGLLAVITLVVVVGRVGSGLLGGALCVAGIVAIAGGVIWYTVRTRRTL